MVLSDQPRIARARDGVVLDAIRTATVAVLSVRIEFQGRMDGGQDFTHDLCTVFRIVRGGNLARLQNVNELVAIDGMPDVGAVVIEDAFPGAFDATVVGNLSVVVVALQQVMLSVLPFPEFLAAIPNVAFRRIQCTSVYQRGIWW